jgi:hypothetical protein
MAGLPQRPALELSIWGRALQRGLVDRPKTALRIVPPVVNRQ